MFDAALFDFDGVLMVEHLTLDAVHQMLQTYGVPGEQLPQQLPGLVLGGDTQRLGSPQAECV